MADLATALTQCPECDEPLLIPVTSRTLTPTTYALHFDFTQVREHVTTHEARFITELLLTAR
ncbi:hypothetical protein [Streptomyces sp. NPDC000888]